MTWLLKFTPLPPKEGMGQWQPPTAPAYYFVRMGDQWPSDPRKRLIDAMSPDIAQAKLFATEEDARAQLVTCDAGKGWEVVEA